MWYDLVLTDIYVLNCFVFFAGKEAHTGVQLVSIPKVLS
jgi:hypothetical protein